MRSDHLSSKLISNKLILTLRDTVENGTGVHDLTKAFGKRYPRRKLNPTTIRQSVITNLLRAGNDLRIVQVFAANKKPSTTEKYKQTDVEELKIEVLKYHPLGMSIRSKFITLKIRFAIWK